MEWDAFTVGKIRGCCTLGSGVVVAIRTSQTHFSEMLELAGRVITLAAGTFEGTQWLVRIDLVVEGFGLIAL